MKGTIKTSLIGIFSILLFPYQSKSQNQDSISYHILYDTVAPKNDLLEFELNELSSMKVTVASKKEEKIADAPSSITAYSSKDIENYGYYTLSDLAQITSGFNISTQFGEKGFITRGQTAGGYNNNKHLILIDGIPVNFARSYKAQIQEELPLFFAQRVEFLKGPASALYGASAFYGVVSMISKDPVTYGTAAEGKFSGGDYDNNLRLMGNVFNRSEKGISSASFGYYQKNSADYVLPNSNRTYQDKNNSVFIKSSYQITQGILGGTTFGVIYMSRVGGLGESWRGYASPLNSVSWKTLVPYLKFQKQLNRKLWINSYIKGNNSVEEASYAIPPPSNPGMPRPILSSYKSNVINAEVLTEFKYTIDTRNSLIFGVNYDQRVEKGNPSSYSIFIFPPDTSQTLYSDTFAYDFKSRSFYFHTISGYVQYQKNIPLLSGLLITGGLRFDKGIIGDYQYRQLSPRIAIVQKITPTLNCKFMTGRALRAPSIKELDLTYQFLNEVNKVKPDSIKLPAIKAEVINTYEMGLYYSGKNVGISGTIFFNETMNEIIPKTLYVPVGGNDTLRGNWILNNSGKTRSRGFEIDAYAILLHNSIKIFANYTYAFAKDSSNNYYSGIPLAQTNAGIVYTNNGSYKWRISIIMKHIEGYLIGGKTRETNNASTFFDINTIFPVTKNIHAEFQIRNLLNDKTLYPGIGIPIQPRTYLISIGITM